MSEIKFYFDESIELDVSKQLAAGGLDVVSAHGLETLGDQDASHLERATAMGRVLCTYDADFLRLSKSITNHAGIIYAKQQKGSIGGWVRELRAIHARLTAEQAQNQVIFLSLQ